MTRLLEKLLPSECMCATNVAQAKKYHQRISLQSFICSILEHQRSELVELSLDILGKSILMRQASCHFKHFQRIIFAGLFEEQPADSECPRGYQSLLGLKVDHFSQASPRPCESQHEAHMYICFARSALCTGKYDLYAQVRPCESQ